MAGAQGAPVQYVMGPKINELFGSGSTFTNNQPIMPKAVTQSPNGTYQPVNVPPASGSGGRTPPAGFNPNDPTAAQSLASAPQFNVNTAAAQGLQSAMANTAQGQYYQPQQITAPMVGATGYQATGYKPAMAESQGYNAVNAGATGYNAQTMTDVPQVEAGQVATTDLSAYTNPYESSVIEGLQKDAMTGQQMASNELGAQATAAKAFGGSRHGLAEGTMAANIQNNLNNQIAGLRQAGFQNAQQIALSDIGNRMQAGLANQGAGMQAGLANMAAMNTAGQFGAGAINAAQMANAAAQNTARQFGATAANTAALQNQQAMNAAGQFGAGAQNTANQFGAQAANTAAQQNQNAYMQAQMANQSAGLQGAQQRLGAASQMGSLAGQAFDMGQQATANLQGVGLQQQAIQQALIDAAKGQYAGYTGAPSQALGYLTQALGASPQPTTTTETKQPGLFDYLTMAATAYRPKTTT